MSTSAKPRLSSHVFAIASCATVALALMCFILVVAGVLTVAKLLLKPAAPLFNRRSEISLAEQSPTQRKEYPNWTKEELREWLGQNGVKFDSYDGWSADQWWEKTGSANSEEAKVAKRTQLIRTGQPAVGIRGYVRVSRRFTEQEAERLAGSIITANDTDAWNWGKFVFYGDRVLVKLIRDKLQWRNFM